MTWVGQESLEQDARESSPNRSGIPNVEQPPRLAASVQARTMGRPCLREEQSDIGFRIEGAGGLDVRFPHND
jgi:hypothetical protein